MKSKMTIFELFSRIKKEKGEDYHTGLVGEELIVKSYKLMTIKQLESLRFIINKIINQKRSNKDDGESVQEKSFTQ